MGKSFAVSSCFVAPLALRFRGGRETVLVSHFMASQPVSLKSQRPSHTVMTAAPVNASAPPPSSPPTSSSDQLFQCPVCKTPYPPVEALQLRQFPAECSKCGSQVLQRNGFIDITPNPSGNSSVLKNVFTQRPGQSIFQLPTTSFAYERGWRNSFARAGFPGIDKELDFFLDFAAPANVVLDMSCGSGLMARRLATSGEFKRVIAADFSESMLRETVRLAKKDITVPEFDVVRADVAALPFIENSLDAVHAGAALHCWPNVQDGLAEIFRVLKPGGKFFATTFLKLAYMVGRERIAARPKLLKAAVRVEDLTIGRRSYRFFEADELDFLFKAAGFTDVDVETTKGCAIVRAKKPEGS